MILFPNAKINLGLNITERRPDNYHNIETVFYPLPWCDILEVVPSKGGYSLTVTGSSIDCPTEKNLVIKALHAFESYTGIKADVDIYLRKIIPDGAGLGGGSSDASFTLKALDAVYNTALTEPELAAMAAGLGADCPFFIYNRPMYASGIGTELSPVNLSLDGMVVGVVKPTVSVSTAQAYAGVKPHRAEVAVATAVSESVDRWSTMLFNDFEPTVFSSAPQIAVVKERIIKELNPLYCSMSGSGSAVYALFGEDSASSEDLRRRLAGMFPESAVFSGRMQ